MVFSSTRELRVLCRRAGFLLLLSLAACARDDIRIYDAPKEQTATAASILPPGWEETSGGGMRIGSYVVRGSGGEEAQVSIIPLPGSSGSELDNVNRWRNQLGLEPIKAEELAQYEERIQIGGEPARMFELAGTAEGHKTRTLAALLKDEHDGTVWFFKMMGDDKLVREQKDAFVKFLATYEVPHDHSEQAAADPPPPPAASAEQRVAQTNWVVPSGWQEKPAGPMQFARFSVAGGEAIVSVSILPASGGDLLAIINLWRTQLGLPAATEADLPQLTAPLELAGGRGTLVDMRGPAQRMVTAIVPKGGQTWYFKLMGTDTAVEAQKNSLVEFVKSSR